MKRIALALLAVAAGFAANSARAHTDVSVGIRFGTPVAVVPPAPVVVAAPAPNYCPPPAVAYEPARGYWKDVTVKTWVPERWVSSRDRWGRLVRFCEPGYYTYRTERVWVETHHDRGYHYGRDSRYDDRYTWNR